VSCLLADETHEVAVASLIAVTSFPWSSPFTVTWLAHWVVIVALSSLSAAAVGGTLAAVVLGAVKRSAVLSPSGLIVVVVAASSALASAYIDLPRLPAIIALTGVHLVRELALASSLAAAGAVLVPAGGPPLRLRRLARGPVRLGSHRGLVGLEAIAGLRDVSLFVAVLALT
jgi:hypothetical protein